MSHQKLINRFYYHAKPYIPRDVQLFLRRSLVRWRLRSCASTWPIDERAGNAPEGWVGWPEGRQFAFVLSHDVDTAKGHDNALELAALEQEMGFRSSFNFVAERYPVSPDVLRQLAVRGFELSVHGLVHDGKLFMSRKIFNQRAVRINHYLKKWGAVGFHSPSMHRNLEWILDLDIEYDQSTFDTDPFEPQPDGAGTIFPFWMQTPSGTKGYVEIPYTLPQDHTIFVILEQKDCGVWKRKLDWIAEKGGLAFLNTHPDYMRFPGRACSSNEEYPVSYYAEFLEYVKRNYQGRYWHPLPRDLARFWRTTMVTMFKGEK